MDLEEVYEVQSSACLHLYIETSLIELLEVVRWAFMLDTCFFQRELGQSLL